MWQTVWCGTFTLICPTSSKITGWEEEKGINFIHFLKTLQQALPVQRKELSCFSSYLQLTHSLRPEWFGVDVQFRSCTGSAQTSFLCHPYFTNMSFKVHNWVCFESISERKFGSLDTEVLSVWVRALPIAFSRIGSFFVKWFCNEGKRIPTLGSKKSRCYPLDGPDNCFCWSKENGWYLGLKENGWADNWGETTKSGLTFPLHPGGSNRAAQNGVKTKCWKESQQSPESYFF